MALGCICANLEKKTFSAFVMGKFHSMNLKVCPVRASGGTLPLILKTLVPLQQSFIPPLLVARGEEFDEIFNSLTAPLPRNLYVYGPKGIGKSVTVLRVIDEIAARFQKIRCMYIQLQSSINATWRARFSNIPERRRGVPWILKTLEGCERGIIVFDDVQTLYRRSDLAHVMKDLHDGSAGRVVFVLVGTESLYAFERSSLCGDVGESVKSRCMFQPVVFRPYAKDEVVAIIRQRLELATGGGGGWEEGALDFIASKVVRHGSDMRLGIRILANAVELALERNSNITLEIAQEAWRREKEDYWMKEYLELPRHKAFLLYQVFHCMERRANGIAFSREVYDAYFKGCALLNVKPMTGRQLFNYLQELEHEGFIKLSIELTPQGKVTKVSSDLQPDIMVSAGAKIEWKKVLA